MENLTGYDYIVCEFAMCTFNLSDREVDFSWFNKEIYTGVQFMCNERNHSICYATTTNEVYTFKNKNKRKSLREIFAYHFLFCICLFLDTNLRKQKHTLTT